MLGCCKNALSTTSGMCLTSMNREVVSNKFVSINCALANTCLGAWFKHAKLKKVIKPKSVTCEVYNHPKLKMQKLRYIY